MALTLTAPVPLGRALLGRLEGSRTAMTAIRAGFLAVPLLGMLGLASDLAALY